ncbi:MAG TPA: hypothetical protein VEH84_09850 [Alphaproteobacteria bacterium]|nr:hypothetical protein [Alphaproteobacteria bacterium]
MRAFDGQRSDSKPVQRTLEEKKRLLARVKEELQALRPTATPTVREGMKARIAQLQEEIARSEAKREARAVADGPRRPPRAPRV